MKIKVEKFTLQRNGAKYPAGSVVDLPDKEADALVKSAPKEFSLLVEPTVQESVEAAEPALEDMDINALRALAAQMGIQVSKNFKRQDYIDAIRSIDGAEEESAELPDADLSGTVK